MQCPYCKHLETKVTDKRDSEGETKRRRECLKCEKRFTTYERVEQDLSVIKKDGRREKFLIEKLRRGIEKSFEKRAVTSEQIDKIVNDIEAKIYKTAKDKDIETAKIGEIIMEKLRKEDEVAYIRFASVYRQFKDISDFKEAIKEIK